MSPVSACLRHHSVCQTDFHKVKKIEKANSESVGLSTHYLVIHVPQCLRALVPLFNLCSGTIRTSVHSYFGTLLFRYTLTSVRFYFGTFIFWYISSFIHSYFGTFVLWYIHSFGTSKFRHIHIFFTIVFQYTHTLVHSYLGTSYFGTFVLWCIHSFGTSNSSTFMLSSYLYFGSLILRYTRTSVHMYFGTCLLQYNCISVRLNFGTLYFSTYKLQYTGTSVHSYLGTFVLRYTRTLVHSYFSTIVLWYICTLEHSYFGTSILWYIQTSVSWHSLSVFRGNSVSNWNSPVNYSISTPVLAIHQFFLYLGLCLLSDNTPTCYLYFGTPISYLWATVPVTHPPYPIKFDVAIDIYYFRSSLYMAIIVDRVGLFSLVIIVLWYSLLFLAKC